MYISLWKPRKLKPGCSAHFGCSAGKKLSAFLSQVRDSKHFQFDMVSFALKLHILSFCQQEQRMRGLRWQMSPTSGVDLQVHILLCPLMEWVKTLLRDIVASTDKIR